MISLHASLDARDFKNGKRSLIPQPPHPFGLTIFSHATQGGTCSTFDPAHRNLLKILLIEAKIIFGTQIRLAQYTGMAIDIDFIKTSLLALDNHFKL